MCLDLVNWGHNQAQGLLILGLGAALTPAPNNGYNTPVKG